MKDCYLINGQWYSQDELYHHGILGMKWGVRRYQNADGTLTEAGRKRYTNSDGTLNEEGKAAYRDRLSDARHKRDWHDRDNTTRNVVMGTDAIKNIQDKSLSVQAATKKLEEAQKYSKEFYGDKGTQLDYKAKALKALNAKFDYGYTDAEIDQMRKDNDIYLWEDWDQGYGNSFQLFLQDKGVNSADYRKNLTAAYDEYKSACKAEVDKILGYYGDTFIYDFYKNESTVSETTVETMLDVLEDELAKRHMYGYYADLG